MLAARATDGYLAPFTFDLIGPMPAEWRPLDGRRRLDPDAWVGNLKPFLIESPSQFRSKGPNALTSTAYTKDFDEVKAIGRSTSTTRTADQTTAAIFWQFAADRALQPARARSLRRACGLDTRRRGPPPRDGEPRGRRRGDRVLERQVPLELLAAAGRDPARRRPTATPTTVADPTWEPLFHASTADHARRSSRRRSPTTRRATAASAAPSSGRSAEFFGTDKVEFDVSGRRRRFPTQPRHFDRFSHALKEVVERARLGRDPLPDAPTSRAR